MNLFKFSFQEKGQRRLILLKNEDLIEIFIPSVGLFSRFTILSLIFLIFPAYLINFFILSIPNQKAAFFTPVIIFNFLISLIAIAVILLSEFSQKRLSITRQKIAWTYEIFNLKIKDPSPALIPGIIRIAKVQHSWKRYFLEIWAGRKLYELSTGEFSPFAVTKPELDLVAKELSNWMELTLFQD
jgi:hypothetical protein